MNFYGFFKIAAQLNTLKNARCTPNRPAQRLTGRAHRPAAHQPESRPTRGFDPRRGAARARCGRGHGVARDDGERRRREAAQRGEA